MTNKEPGHLRIELPGFNVLNCKHLRDIIFQLPQGLISKVPAISYTAFENTGLAMHRSSGPGILHCTGLDPLSLGQQRPNPKKKNAGKDGRSYGYSLSLHQ